MNNDNLILSPELQQELADIRDIISEKYRQFLQQQESSRRAENNDAANLYSNAVDVLEPLFLFDKYMNTQSGFNKDDLEQYGSLLRSAMSDLSVIYNNLENLNEANDALFVNMNLLDEKVDNFIVRLNGDLEKNPQREMKAKDKQGVQPVLPEKQKAKDVKSKVGLLNVGVPLDKVKFKQKEQEQSQEIDAKPIDKSSKFKDGIVNVLNKQRDEKSHTKTKDDKEKQDAFVQMLHRKKMKGFIE